jgi:hypothetical protein
MELFLSVAGHYILRNANQPNLDFEINYDKFTALLTIAT